MLETTGRMRVENNMETEPKNGKSLFLWRNIIFEDVFRCGKKTFRVIIAFSFLNNETKTFFLVLRRKMFFIITSFSLYNFISHAMGGCEENWRNNETFFNCVSRSRLHKSFGKGFVVGLVRIIFSMEITAKLVLIVVR